MRWAAPCARWIRYLLVCIVCGMPVLGVSAQSSEDLDIDIEVVPGPHPTADPHQDWPSGSPAHPLPRVVSAGLTEVENAMTPHGIRTTAFDLVVEDTRQTAGGWIVSLHNAPEASASDPPALSRYLRRTLPLSGQPLHQVDGPRGNRLSLGQPLDRTTPVIVAHPGAGAGMYSVRFEIAGEPTRSLDATSLVVSVTSAP